MIRSIKFIIVASILLSVCYLLVFPMATETAAAGSHTAKIVEGVNGQPKVVVNHHDGAELEVYLHGATVTSFKTASKQQLIFVSSKAIFDGVKPIRGGIPIVFPQFGTNGPLPQHGFARNRAWTLGHSGDGFVEFTLHDNEATRAVWPHAFHLTYRVEFNSAHLSTSLSVLNPKGSSEPFSFDALLHTYLYTGANNAESIRIHGLKGTKYVSKTEAGAIKDELEDDIILDREVDRVYYNTPVDVEVTHLTSGAEAEPGTNFNAVSVKRSAAIRDAGPGLHTGSLHAPLDVVVWNAHKERCKTIADFGEQDYCHYVCVEPGRVYPPASTELAPGKQWTIKQEISLKSSSA